MEPSAYQLRILNWLKTGKGHGCCNAVAGSGKSTTLRLAAIALQESGLSPSDIKIIVFGKANSLDLVAKFGKAWEKSISTLHSAGWSILKQYLKIPSEISRGLIQSNKYKKIAQDLDLIKSRANPRGNLKAEGALSKEDDFLKLLDLIRLTNQEPTAEAIDEITSHFEIEGIYEPSILAAAIKECLVIGQAQARKRQAFDFTDQIWLPVQWKLTSQKWFKPYKFVLVDECQDLNASQLELAMGLAGQNGRLLFVGDPNQAIMGFAGADNNSYYNIVERTQATELPLSICYRCPKSHIDLVKWNFPGIPIEAREDAEKGSITRCEESELKDLLQTGDLVISRKTAPLVSLCIRLIARGIAAKIKGRDIGEALKRDLEDIASLQGFQYSNFNEAIAEYKAIKFARFENLDNAEQLRINLSDKLDAIKVVYQSQVNAKNIEDLKVYIDQLFSDEKSAVTLSTCHRAKGLEGDRIFIHKAEDMPMEWRDQLDWQLEQENNLLYVALTRSKSELFIVGKPEWLFLGEKQKTEEEAEVEPETETEFEWLATEEDIEMPEVFNVGVEETESDHPETYTDSTLMHVEYVSGSESHASTYAEFYVHGLDQWAVCQTDDEPEADSNYKHYICLDIPENQVFTVFRKDGDKFGVKGYNFFICKTSKALGTIPGNRGNGYCGGDIEVICKGEGKTKAPRLFGWWIDFTGKSDENKRTNEQKLAFAQHCANFINKRGIKELPPFELPKAEEGEPEKLEILEAIAAVEEKAIAPDPQPQPEQKSVKIWVPLDKITLDAGTQPTTRHDQSTVEEYADLMKSGQWDWHREPLPQLKDDGEFKYPADGHHRIEAAFQAGETDIFCEVSPGTLRDAIYESLGANRFHGLKRTDAVKWEVVQRTLSDAEWAKMSDRAIAQHCGVSAPFVGKVRTKLAEEGTVNINSKRVDRRGREIETSNIGTKPKSERATAKTTQEAAASNGHHNPEQKLAEQVTVEINSPVQTASKADKVSQAKENLEALSLSLEEWEAIAEWVKKRISLKQEIRDRFTDPNDLANDTAFDFDF